MSDRVRLRLFAVAIAGLLGLMLWGFAGLPDFGDYRGPTATSSTAWRCRSGPPPTWSPP